jgi:hypothetical protein
MSAKRYPMLAHPADGHGGPVHSHSTSVELDTDEDFDEQVPPLPSDPRVRAEIRAGIEQGLAEVRAGAGIPWSVVKAELEAIVAAKRK